MAIHQRFIFDLFLDAFVLLTLTFSKYLHEAEVKDFTQFYLQVEQSGVLFYLAVLKRTALAISLYFKTGLLPSF